LIYFHVDLATFLFIVILKLQILSPSNQKHQSTKKMHQIM